jgi:hypothetical protein
VDETRGIKMAEAISEAEAHKVKTERSEGPQFVPTYTAKLSIVAFNELVAVLPPAARFTNQCYPNTDNICLWFPGGISVMLYAEE